jgi:hypothetical protein
LGNQHFLSQPYFGRVGGWLSHSRNGDLGVRRTLKISEFDFVGQNTLHWNILYIIGKLSKRRCRKWACKNDLEICSTSYVKRKGRESNWQFDSQPLKIKNQLDPGVCRWSATHRWKALDRATSLLRPYPNQRSEQRVMTPQSGKSPNRDSFETPWESQDKKSFGCRCSIEVQRSPKSPVACPSTKGAVESELTNLLVGWMHIRMSN